MSFSEATHELFAPVEKSLHVLLRLAGEIGLPEGLDADIDRLRQRQVFPLSQQRLLISHGLRRTFGDGGCG